MASFADKYNPQRIFWVNTAGFEYYKLEELYKANGGDEVYPVKALFVNTKGRFGDSAVIVTDRCFVNLPVHMLGTVNDILTDEEAIQEIKAGNVGFMVYEYFMKKYNRKCYSVRFVDISMPPEF